MFINKKYMYNHLKCTYFYKFQMIIVGARSDFKSALGISGVESVEYTYQR